MLSVKDVKEGLCVKGTIEMGGGAMTLMGFWSKQGRLE